MILRRITDAIKKQSWFQVIVEIFIVVIGIFLGLQVQAWYDGRIAAVEERRVVGIFISDMERTIKFYDGQLSNFEIQINLTDGVIKIIESGVLRPEDISAFEEGIFRYGRTQDIDTYLNSFYEANLNRVLDNNLRLMIDDYLGHVKRNKTVINNIKTRMEQARSLTTIKAGVRQTLTGKRKSYYNFEHLKDDAEYHAAVVNINGFEFMARERFVVMKKSSQLLLEVLKKYQVGEPLEGVPFDLEFRSDPLLFNITQ